MTIRTRQKTQTNWWGYYGPCGQQMFTHNGTYVYSLEHVDSLTTGREYLEDKNLGRRVLKFKPFEKYSRVTPTSGTVIFCSGGDTAYLPGHPLDWILLGISATQGTMPIVGRANLASIALPYLDKARVALESSSKEPLYNASVALATLGDTVGSIKDAALGAVSLLTKDFPWKNLMKVHELWLWYRYVLMTTILDITQLIQAFQTPEWDPIVKTSDSVTKIENVSFSTGAWFYKYQWPYTGVDEYNIRYSSQGYMLYRKDPSPWGTSLQDVLAAGWEVIPFSFVVDWFLGVSDWLTSLRAVDIQWLQRYYSVSITRSLKINPSVVAGGGCMVEEKYYTRSLDTTLPLLPVPSDKWTTTIRQIDAAALAVGLLSNIVAKKRATKLK